MEPLYNLKYVKQALYALLFALIILGILYPLIVAANYQEPSIYFPNYELRRKNIESIRNEQKADDGQGLLQPEQNLPSGKPILGSDEKSKIAQTDNAKSNSASKRRPAAVNTETQKSKPIQASSNNKLSAKKPETFSGRYYSKDEVIELVKSYSAQYGISADSPLCIAKLESGYNQFSKNKSSSASGVFQYLDSTWRSTDEGKAGFSVFDADSNVRAAVRHMAVHKDVTPWVVWQKCPPLTFL